MDISFEFKKRNKFKVEFKNNKYVKICNDCLLEKEITEFYKINYNNKTYYTIRCKKCERIRRKPKEKQYRKDNKKSLLDSQNKYYKNNREFILQKSRESYHSNLEYQKNRRKKYYEQNKEKIKEKRRLRVNKKRKSNPVFKIKENISRRIRGCLKKNKSSKNGISFKKNLPYTMQELKQYIENQFEPWMNWNNWGVYNKNIWNDQDSSTWTWQIDHIIPHSTFKYTSMEDEEFKKCWALDNLRPLSSKINFNMGIDLLRGKKR